MIKVNEPYSSLAVAIVENEYFDRNRVYNIELTAGTHIVTPISVNERKLQRYEWEYKEGIYYITLKDWA